MLWSDGRGIVVVMIHRKYHMYIRQDIQAEANRLDFEATFKVKVFHEAIGP